jgi:two-component system, OmpR family, sensor kinase
MRWYKSLYWRIALGFVLFLAAMLVVQGILFVWVLARSGQTLPGQSPGRFSETIARDLTNALEREPGLDVARYVREQYAQWTHPFFVMMADGRMITSGSGTFPQPLIRMAQARLQRRADRTDIDRSGPRPERNRSSGIDREALRESRGFRFVRPTPITVNHTIAGVVVVPPDAPFSVILGRFAPMLSAVAAGTLIVGTIAASMMIFGPARRRLRELESAARRLGGGELSARAPDRGGDEIAAVAGAFNAMADDLGARADALAASDRARRQLLADVSHELTTPVTAMRGYLETLTMPEMKLDATTTTRYLGIISDETARLERIIGDLLDLARLEGGGGAFSVEDVAVAQLFDRVTARHERACAAHQIRMMASIERGAETVWGDRDRLEQALQNLAGNAMRYAPCGSDIRLIARPDGRSVVIAVEDDGPGIPAEHLPHIFDRFYKAESSRALDQMDGERRAGMSNGSGLGLSIVKAIIERHGGQISAESRPGRTVFQFTLSPEPESEP